MNDHPMLTRHSDIQNWVNGRHGMPAIVRSPSSTGRMKASLALRFDRPRRPSGMPSIDQGMSPVSWSAWFSEFDRQQLALKVVSENEFELIARKDLN
ncbi:MAG: hypothetical protein ABIO40_08835 [Devosia sp.]